MAKKSLPPSLTLNQMFDYDRDTGIVRYKRQRPSYLFAHNAHWVRYHKLYAGKPVTTSLTQRYMRVRIDGTQYQLHRIIWKMVTGEEPTWIDHKNRDIRDNRWQNLRLCTLAESSANRGSSGKTLRGTYYHEDERYKNRWRAVLRVRGKTIHIGHFSTEQEAHEAYLAAARKAFGEFFYDRH